MSSRNKKPYRHIMNENTHIEVIWLPNKLYRLDNFSYNTYTKYIKFSFSFSFLIIFVTNTPLKYLLVAFDLGYLRKKKENKDLIHLLLVWLEYKPNSFPFTFNDLSFNLASVWWGEKHFSKKSYSYTLFINHFLEKYFSLNQTQP